MTGDEYVFYGCLTAVGAMISYFAWIFYQAVKDEGKWVPPEKSSGEPKVIYVDTFRHHRNPRYGFGALPPIHPAHEKELKALPPPKPKKRVEVERTVLSRDDSGDPSLEWIQNEPFRTGGGEFGGGGASGGWDSTGSTESDDRVGGTDSATAVSPDESSGAGDAVPSAGGE